MSDQQHPNATYPLHMKLPEATPLTEADAKLVDSIRRKERYDVAVKAFGTVVKEHLVQGEIGPRDANFGLSQQFEARLHSLSDKGQETVHAAARQAFREIAKDRHLRYDAEVRFEQAYHDGIASKHLPELPHKPYSKAPQR